MKGTPWGGIHIDDDGIRVPLSIDEAGRPTQDISLRTEAAVALADMASIWHDLSITHARCLRYLEMDHDDDGITRDALFEAVVMSYSRAFTEGRSSARKGRRRRVQHLVDELTQQQSNAHQEAIRLRNKHIGHRTGDDEHAHVVARFDSTGAFLDISPLVASFGSGERLVAQIAENSHTMATLAADIIDDEMRVLHESLAAAGVKYSDFTP